MAIDLQQFCIKEPCRYAINKPFMQRGCLYATDGRIAIRTKMDGPDSHDKVPNAHALFAKYTWTKLKPLPPLKLKCSACGGTGYVTCPTCKCDHACEQCDGQMPSDPVRLFGYLFDPHCLALVASIPDVKAKCADTGDKDSLGNKAFALVFGNGQYQGILYPMV